MLIFLSMLESDAERQLFLELYNQYGNAMLRLAQRYFPKSRQDAEDKKRGAYLVIIARNEAITILRKRRKELPLDDAFADETAAFEAGDERPIIQIIQTMPDTFRAVLEMRFVEERSTKEIAAALQLHEHL